MTDGEAQAAFRYLSDKGLIATHFGIPFSGRMTAAGHDAIKEAESTPDKTSPAFPAITNKYYMTVHNMMGSNVQQGTTNSHITATQSITTQQLIEGVQRLIEQLDPSTLPAPLQDPTRKAIAELRTAVDEPMPDVNRLHRGLQSLKRVMEHTTGHLVATGVLGLIAQLLSAGVAH